MAALVLGASIAVACMVYDPSDLVGEPLSGSAGGGVAGGSGSPDGGHGAEVPTTGGSAGSAGSPAGGGGSGGAPVAGLSGEAGSGGAEADAGEPNVAGSGGTAGTQSGGSSGTGTAGAPMVDRKLIDDCEDHDNRIKRVQHPEGVFRNGFWYTGVVPSDSNAVIEPAPGTEVAMSRHPETPAAPSASNEYAFRLLARQLNEDEPGYGAIAGFNFLEPKAPYDASSFSGISFSARASAVIDARFKIVIKGTDPSGGICSGNNCSDHFFIEVKVGTEWAPYRVSWVGTALQQEGWGTQVDFEPTELMSMEFFVPAYETNPEVELWIDDVTFFEQE